MSSKKFICVKRCSVGGKTIDEGDELEIGEHITADKMTRLVNMGRVEEVEGDPKPKTKSKPKAKSVSDSMTSRSPLIADITIRQTVQRAQRAQPSLWVWISSWA